MSNASILNDKGILFYCMLHHVTLREIRPQNLSET